MPLCVGGGVDGFERARDLLLAGADKVSVNTAALDRPELIEELADQLGSQCVVVAIDAARADGSWEAHASAGMRPTGRDAIEWSREAVERGAGELLVTSIDADGGHAGYDLELIAAVTEPCACPSSPRAGPAARPTWRPRSAPARRRRWPRRSSTTARRPSTT